MSPRPASGWVLAVGDLLRHSGSHRQVEAELELGALSVVETRVPEGAVTEVTFRLDALDSAITATGTVRSPWEGVCRRCLTPIDGRLEASVLEVFDRHPVEGETWPILGDQIDLGEVVREAVLLELPIAPLCREDCAGLCPTCGTDLNAGPCGCDDVPADPRWAALGDLRLDDE